MRRSRLACLCVLTLAAVATLAPPSPAEPLRASLPAVLEGPRPGPAVLYADLAKVPQLSVGAPFKAKPLMVSGTDAYCNGEYLYQDYLFDDHGANTRATLANGGAYGIFPPAGDVTYPPDQKYANNAADIVEVRIRPTADALVFRVTLNTVLARDATVIGIGIDRDRKSVTPVAWPDGAGISSPGLDSFITAWGTGGAVRRRAGNTLGSRTALRKGAVTTDPRTNQMTIRVPKSVLNPGRSTWRIVAGAGVNDATRFRVVEDAPAVYNLAFRFDEKQGGDNNGNTAIGYGNWFDESQGGALADATSGTAFANVNFAKLPGAGCRRIHAPGRDQARIFASRLQIPEGVQEEASPYFGGRLQPYMVRIPPKSSRRPGVTLALHGNSATYTQWHVIMPNYLRQIGDERNHVILSPLGRSTSGSGISYDWFEAWNDLAHRVPLDSERASLSGYSAGGYNTFALGVRFPDLFGSAFAIVGAGRLLNGGLRGDRTNMNPMMSNLRWVPVVSWNQLVDELAPYIGIRTTHDELKRLGLRNELYTFPVGEHFTPGILDRWTGGAAYLGDGRVVRDPHRIDHTIAPELWTMLNPELTPGDNRYPRAHLIADHAYWLSSLRVRKAVRDETSTIRGSISALSHAFGLGNTATAPVLGPYLDPPLLATIDGTSWNATQRVPARNALTLQLTNIRNAVIWGRRAKLSVRKPLTIDVTSDGPATVRVVLPFGPSTTIRRSGPGALDPTFDSKPGVLLRVRGATSRFVFSP